jgi:hypothetical protein
MVESNMNGDEPRLVLTGGSGARVVLAEADAPGSLHYLLEAEGFQVVGCASTEDELGRVLGQGVRPDVIVLDADVVASSSLVARQLAPEAHVIAVWPDAVQPPPGGERVDPRMVYEELGPAIRRHMDRRTVPVPVIAMPAEEPVMAGVAAAAAVPMAPGSVFARVASRVSVLSATLITAIVLTMGVSFALGGFRWHPSDGSPRVVVPRSSDAGRIDTSDPLNGRVPSGVGNGDPGSKPTDHPGGSNDHHGAGGIASVVATTGGGSGDTGSPPGDQTGGSGDQGSGQGDQGSGQGDQGGGQGDQGGGQGDQGGGQGDQGGGQGDQGGGDHGGGGDQGGGGGQGDQGGDGQHGGGDGQDDQDGDSQGEDEQGGGQGDQGGDSQGGDSQDGHGAHSDVQNNDNQN